MARLDILDEIERKADGYLITSIFANIAFQVASLYAIDKLVIYVLRTMGCPC